MINMIKYDVTLLYMSPLCDSQTWKIENAYSQIPGMFLDGL